MNGNRAATTCRARIGVSAYSLRSNWQRSSATSKTYDDIEFLDLDPLDAESPVWCESRAFESFRTQPSRVAEDDPKEAMMAGEMDKAKGRIKEAAGALTDDDDRKKEGKADQAAGEAKEKVDKAKDWAEDKIDDLKDRVDRK